MAARKKSLQDIRNQAYRISRQLMMRGYDASQSGDFARRRQIDDRMVRVLDTADRYASNISRKLEKRNDGYLSNGNYTIKVGCSTYMGNNGW